MAVIVTSVVATGNRKIADVEATADADAAAVIPHGMAAAPKVVIITPTKSNGVLKGWYVDSIDATNVNLACGVAGGSGVAGNQIRVTIELPHSING